MNIAQLQYVR